MLSSKFYEVGENFLLDDEIRKNINDCLKQVMNDGNIKLEEKAVYFYLHHAAMTKYEMIYVVTHAMKMDLQYATKHLNISANRFKKALYGLCKSKYLDSSELDFCDNEFSFGFNIPIYRMRGKIGE